MTEKEQIPEGIYYATDAQGFYDDRTKDLQDRAFQEKWMARKDEFPQKKAEGIPIEEFAARSPENAQIIAEIMKGIQDGTLQLS